MVINEAIPSSHYVFVSLILFIFIWIVMWFSFPICVHQQRCCCFFCIHYFTIVFVFIYYFVNSIILAIIAVCSTVLYLHTNNHFLWLCPPKIKEQKKRTRHQTNQHKQIRIASTRAMAKIKYHTCCLMLLLSNPNTIAADHACKA